METVDTYSHLITHQRSIADGHIEDGPGILQQKDGSQNLKNGNSSVDLKCSWPKRRSGIGKGN